MRYERDVRPVGRWAARWLQRYLEEQPTGTIGDAGFAATLLSALGANAHAEAVPAPKTPKPARERDSA